MNKAIQHSTVQHSTIQWDIVFTHLSERGLQILGLQLQRGDDLQQQRRHQHANLRHEARPVSDTTGQEHFNTTHYVHNDRGHTDEMITDYSLYFLLPQLLDIPYGIFNARPEHLFINILL